MHDRSDYKHGWQIEQELAEGTYGVDGEDNRYEILNNSSDDEREDLPHHCLICRKEFKDPVVTMYVKIKVFNFCRCRHYFCSECALKRYKKTARCYACTADTKGFFKFAKNLIERIKSSKAVCHDHSHSSDVEGNVERTSEICSRDVVSKSSLENVECDAGSVFSQNQVKLPASKESNWAKAELVEYCNSEEESD